MSSSRRRPPRQHRHPRVAWSQTASILPEMVLIPPGSFVMGVPEAKSAREKTDDTDARPQRKVTFHQGFYLEKYPVTCGEFAAFVAETGYQEAGPDWRDPALKQTERDPVVRVNAIDAEAFVAWLSRRSGNSYRLPSEAEWEYAARAGTATARFWAMVGTTRLTISRR